MLADLALVVAAVLAAAGGPAARPRACLASDLTARAAFQGATGAAEGGVVVTNRSRSRCTVSGRPLVDLLVNGRRLDVRQVLGRPTKNRRPQPYVLLAPGQGAFVHIRWSNWCGARNAPVHLRLWIMTVQPRVQVRGTIAAPRCDSAAARSTVAVGPFESLRRS